MGERTNPGFQWWAGNDEERMTVGPEDSREAIIQAATNDMDGEPFTILEARHAVPRLPSADAMLGLFFDINEDLGDPDGDGFGHDVAYTTEQEAELEDQIRPIFEAWFDKHGWPSTWIFGDVRNKETITPPRDGDEEEEDHDNGTT